MTQLFFDGLGKIYTKPKNIESVNRLAAYTLIKDVSSDSYLFYKPHAHSNIIKLIGGGVKNNETLLEGLTREIKEEVNIDLIDPNFYFFSNNQVGIKYFKKEKYVTQKQYCYYIELDLNNLILPDNIVRISDFSIILRDIHYSQKDFALKYFY